MSSATQAKTKFEKNTKIFDNHDRKRHHTSSIRSTELVLLCLDYLSDLRRGHSTDYLKDVEGRHSIFDPNKPVGSIGARVENPSSQNFHSIPSLTEINQDILDSPNPRPYEEDYDDLQYSNCYRFFPCEGFANGPTDGPLTLQELVDAGLLSRNARMRKHAEAQVIDSTQFGSFVKKVKLNGYFADSENSIRSKNPYLEEQRKARKFQVYQTKYRKLVAKYRSRIGSRYEELGGDLSVLLDSSEPKSPLSRREWKDQHNNPALSPPISPRLKWDFEVEAPPEPLDKSSLDRECNEERLSPTFSLLDKGDGLMTPELSPIASPKREVEEKVSNLTSQTELTRKPKYKKKLHVVLSPLEQDPITMEGPRPLSPVERKLKEKREKGISPLHALSPRESVKSTPKAKQPLYPMSPNRSIPSKLQQDSQQTSKSSVVNRKDLAMNSPIKSSVSTGSLISKGQKTSRMIQKPKVGDESRSSLALKCQIVSSSSSGSSITSSGFSSLQEKPSMHALRANRYKRQAALRRNKHGIRPLPKLLRAQVPTTSRRKRTRSLEVKRAKPRSRIRRSNSAPKTWKPISNGHIKRKSLLAKSKVPQQSHSFPKARPLHSPTRTRKHVPSNNHTLAGHSEKAKIVVRQPNQGKPSVLGLRSKHLLIPTMRDDESLGSNNQVLPVKTHSIKTGQTKPMHESTTPYEHHKGTNGNSFSQPRSTKYGREPSTIKDSVISPKWRRSASSKAQMDHISEPKRDRPRESARPPDDAIRYNSPRKGGERLIHNLSSFTSNQSNESWLHVDHDIMASYYRNGLPLSPAIERRLASPNRRATTAKPPLETVGSPNSRSSKQGMQPRYRTFLV